MNRIADKAALRGMKSLSDEELLTLLVEDEQLARTLLSTCGGSPARLAGEPETRLRMIGGLGLRRARQLLAAAEWGRRVASEGVESEFVTTSDDVVHLFRPQLEALSHEECWAVYLTSSNRIVERQRVSQGGVTSTVVDHRLIVKRALELLSTRLILIHNHPSGLDREGRACRGAVRHPPAGPHHHRPRRGFLVPRGGAAGVTRRRALSRA